VAGNSHPCTRVPRFLFVWSKSNQSEPPASGRAKTEYFVSTTLTRSRSDRQQAIEAPRFLGNGHQRRPLVAVASLALVTCCIAVFTSVYLHAGNKASVLAVAHDLPLGHVITQSDLAVVRVSFSPGLTPIPAAEAGQVIGRETAASLFRGTLLSAAELTAHGSPARGKAIVGIATKAGQLPAEGVSVGDTVDVILTGSAATLTGGASEGSVAASSSTAGQAVQIGGVLAPNAIVTGVATSGESSADTVVVSVLIPASLAPLVASASAAGQTALALVAPSR
jgi:hypothetical protein